MGLTAAPIARAATPRSLVPLAAQGKARADTCQALLTLQSLSRNQRTSLHQECTGKSASMRSDELSLILRRLSGSDWQRFLVASTFAARLSVSDQAKGARTFADGINSCLSAETSASTEKLRNLADAANAKLFRTAAADLSADCEGVDADSATQTAQSFFWVRAPLGSLDQNPSLFLHDGTSAVERLAGPLKISAGDSGEAAQFWLARVPRSTPFTVVLHSSSFRLPWFRRYENGLGGEVDTLDLSNPREWPRGSILEVVVEPPETAVFIDGTRVSPGGVTVPVSEDNCEVLESSCYAPSFVHMFASNAPNGQFARYIERLRPPQHGRKDPKTGEYDQLDDPGDFRLSAPYHLLERDFSDSALITLLDVDVSPTCGAIDQEALWLTGKSRIEGLTTEEKRPDAPRDFLDIRGIAGLTDEIRGLRRLLAPDRRRTPVRAPLKNRGVRDRYQRQANPDAPNPRPLSTDDALNLGTSSLWRRGVRDVVRVRVACDREARQQTFTVTAQKLDLAKFASTADQTRLSSADNPLASSSAKAEDHDLERAASVALHRLFGEPSVRIHSFQRETTINRSVFVSVELDEPTATDATSTRDAIRKARTEAAAMAAAKADAKTRAAKASQKVRSVQHDSNTQKATDRSSVETAGPRGARAEEEALEAAKAAAQAANKALAEATAAKLTTERRNAGRIWVDAYRISSSEGAALCPRLESGDRAEIERVEERIDDKNFGHAIPVIRETNERYEIWPAWGGVIVVRAALYEEEREASDRGRDRDVGKRQLRRQSRRVKQRERSQESTDQPEKSSTPTAETAETTEKSGYKWNNTRFGPPSIDEGKVDAEFVCIEVEDDMPPHLWIDAGVGAAYPVGVGRRRQLGYGQARNPQLARNNRWAEVRAGFDLSFWYRRQTRLILGGSMGYATRTLSLNGLPSWGDLAADGDRSTQVVRRSGTLTAHAGLTTHSCSAPTARRSLSAFAPCTRASRKIYWRFVVELGIDAGRVDVSEIPQAATSFRANRTQDHMFDTDVNLGAQGVVGYRISPHVAAALFARGQLFAVDDFILFQSVEGTARDDRNLGWLTGIHMVGYL